MIISINLTSSKFEIETVTLVVKVYTSHVCKISNQDSVTHRYNENEILTQKRKTRTCIESLINTHLSNLVGA